MSQKDVESEIDGFYEEWADRLRTNCESCEHPICEAHRKGFRKALFQLLQDAQRNVLKEIDESLVPNGDFISQADMGNEQHQLIYKGFNMYRRRVLGRIAELQHPKDDKQEGGNSE